MILSACLSGSSVLLVHRLVGHSVRGTDALDASLDRIFEDSHSLGYLVWIGYSFGSVGY